VRGGLIFLPKILLLSVSVSAFSSDFLVVLLKGSEVLAGCVGGAGDEGEAKVKSAGLWGDGFV
jgi:hypothetical protein